MVALFSIRKAGFHQMLMGPYELLYIEGLFEKMI